MAAHVAYSSTEGPLEHADVAWLLGRCSSFRAERAALINAINEMVLTRRLTNKRIVIFTDSMNNLQALMKAKIELEEEEDRVLRTGLK